MFSTQSNYGFASSYPKPYTFNENMLCSYTQGYLGVHPSVLGCWYAPARGSEVGPWAWQWNERIRTQEVPIPHHPYMASVSQPLVQPTNAVDQAPPALSRALGRPVLNTNRPEIICPRPIHPLPKWIDMTGWDDDEDETASEEDEERFDLTPDPEGTDDSVDREGGGKRWANEEDYGEEFDVPRRFLPSFILSPDPEDLPAPFFHPPSDSPPSSCSLASLSPDAGDLPQPHFDSDPYSPVSEVSSWWSTPRLDHSRSSRLDSSGSIVAPDPEDLPPPDFGTYDRHEVGGFKFPEPGDRRQDRTRPRGARDHAGWGLGEGRQEVVVGGGRKVRE